MGIHKWGFVLSSKTALSVEQRWNYYVVFSIHFSLLDDNDPMEKKKRYNKIYNVIWECQTDKGRVVT